jgi:KaiC/GvpD/RAD55 family RecA-like ATPase
MNKDNEILNTTPQDLEDFWGTFENGTPKVSPKIFGENSVIKGLRSTTSLSYIPTEPAPAKPVFSLDMVHKEFEDLLSQEPKKGDIKNESAESQGVVIKNNEKHGLFLIRPANDWINLAKNRPTPNRLYFDFWFEYELCCLFASSNVGKSILAVQIAVKIAESQKILYFDMELSAKQFEGRYSNNYTNHYHFSDNFFRVELDPNFIPDNQSFEEILNESLERAITETGARVLIIDNLTYLKNDTEKAKDALSLMKYLKTLKSKYNLSILVLAHTPKRDFTKPLSINDLAGSSMLGNFFDSCFTIGASAKDKNLRYLKQIKVRECEKKYDADNVVTHQIIKHLNFVEFEFIGFGSEKEHLKEVSEKDNSELIERIVQLHSEQKSYREIGRELGISHMKVKRILEKRLP